MAFYIILVIGLITRFLFVGNTGFVADISFWKSWSLGAIDHGIVWTAFNTNINYPPGFIYILWIMGKIYTLFGDPHNFNEFWRENNFGFLFASKSIAIFADVVIYCLIYWFFHQKEKLKELGLQFGVPANSKDSSSFIAKMVKHLPLILASVFFLHPVVIIDSALWGQVESFGLLFTLVAILLIFYKKPLPAAFIFVLGTQMKLQNIIFIPLFFIFIYKYFDFKSLIKSLASACFAFFLINLPFVLTHNMTKVLELLTTNSDYFPMLSLNAHNPWWIVAGGNGMGVNDKLLILGIINAKTMGLILLSSAYLLATLAIWKRPQPKTFLFALAMAIFSFFLLTTQSHERYSYPALVLLIFYFPFIFKGNTIKKSISNKSFIFIILYILLSISIFFNLHTGLIANYPENGIGFLTWLTRSNLAGFGIINSIVMTALFFVISAFYFDDIPLSYSIIPISTIFLGSLALNLKFFLGNSIPLGTLKPISVKQDYGILQTNKSVNSYQGWKSWNRLGPDYFFYDKGLGTHANSDIIFDVNGNFSRFKTDYGVNVETSTEASVVFIIKGDGKELFKSKVMRHFDFPESASVDITGVKHLELVVTDAGDSVNNDHADWLNPVLIK